MIAASDLSDDDTAVIDRALVMEQAAVDQYRKLGAAESDESYAAVYQRLVEEEGMSVLLSTAYLDEAERCDHVLLLNAGRWAIRAHLERQWAAGFADRPTRESRAPTSCSAG